MSRGHVLAILAGLVLILPMLQQNAFAPFAADTRKPTSIELDFIDECINSLTCNAKIFTGTTIKFTGMLTSDEGTLMRNVPVDIVALIPAPKLEVLTTGETDIDGIFEVEWVAKLSAQKTAFQDVTRQFRSESLTVHAAFPGDEQFAPSKSNKITMSLSVNSIHPIVNSDQTTYEPGETVTIFVAFIDSADNFVDPDGTLVTLNNEFIELERKKEGSYTYMITDVAREHLQIMVVPETEGYNSFTAFLTIIVGGLR